MKTFKIALPILLFLITINSQSQDIWDFTSITPTTQTDRFIIASSHTFQKILKVYSPCLENSIIRTIIA